MSVNSDRVAKRFMKATVKNEDGEDSGAQQPESTVPVTPNLFVDLMTFTVAYEAFTLFASEKGTTPEEKKLLDRIAKRGLLFVRRYMPHLNQGVQQYLAQILDQPGTGLLKAPYLRASRMGAPNTQIHIVAHFITLLMPWLKSHATFMQGIFPGRATMTARSLATACQEQAPLARINKLAAIPPASGIQTFRKWIQQAASAAGVPLSPTEGALSDATVAKGLGEELKHVNAGIETADPNTPEGAALEEKKINILKYIEDVATNSPDPNTVRATAVSAATTTSIHATEIGKRLGHTPDQEAAMMARGKVLIAAGAGSGKTRCLASQVAYHINELGVPPTSVLATSFTRKASAELVKRIGKYGAVVEGPAKDGFGTTHAICGNLLNKQAREFRRPSYFGRDEAWKQTTVLRLAIEQVKMRAAGGLPPRPAGLWDGAYVPDRGTQTEQGVPNVDQQQDEQLRYAVNDAMGYFQWAARTWPGERGRWAAQAVSFLRSVQGTSVRDLRQDQKNAINEIFSRVRVKGQNTVTFRLASAQEKDESDGTPEPKTKRNKLEDYTYFNKPARQWFNLGRDLTREIEGAQGKGKVAIAVGEFKNAISILKGKGLSPSEAWAGKGPYPPESDYAAVYGAYEWLKGPHGEPEFAGQGDMDDILIDTVRALVGSPTVRHQIQAQYRVVLVDEAQDLNRVQHLLFGLVAGHLDPETLEPRADGKMTADTFAYIGDDKQCCEISTKILMADGTTRCAGDLLAGDHVMSYRNGALEAQIVRHVVPSGWDWGYKVTLESGKSLTMSPNHQLWATEPVSKEPVSKEGEVIVYGKKILEDRHLSFNMPHWASQGYTKHSRARYVIQLLAHTSMGTQVLLEWNDDALDLLVADVPPSKKSVTFTTNDSGYRRLRRYFKNYREAISFTEMLASRTNAVVVERLSTPNGDLRHLTASSLFVGMELPSIDDDGNLELDPIASIEKVSGKFIDLDVDDASNFIGDGILSHNSIYSFRGADPDEFIDKSDKIVNPKTGKPGAFATRLLDTNFRSGAEIVDAANKLIAHNKRQVPMVCKATPEKGPGKIVARSVDSTEAAAQNVAEEVEGLVSAGHVDAYNPSAGAGGYASFGIAVRSNAEAYHYGLEMLKRGIPFKSNASFFGDPNTKALIGWLTIAEHGLNGSAELLNDAVRAATRAPFSKLGRAFFTKMDEKAKGPWPKWLVDGGWKDIYDWEKWSDILKHFTDNLEAVAKMKGSPSKVLDSIMELKGIDGSSLRESLIHAVEENDEVMAQLAAESDTGNVSEDQIVEQALAPIAPLTGLLGGKDDIGEAMAFVHKLQAVNQRISSRDTEKEIDRDAVTIGTMHSWKGLEVPHMYVPVVGGKFPRTGKGDLVPEGPDLWSERRLAYVAITRAEQHCTILDIPNPKFGIRSQFIQEACIREEGEPADAGAAPGKVASIWNKKTVQAFLRRTAALGNWE